MNDIIKELDKLGKEIEKAKNDRAQLEGKLSALEERLLKEFNISNVKDISNLLVQYREEETKLSDTISSRFDLLKKQYEW